MSALQEAFDARLKYTHFRILVIGRANAGKTTLLKRVCNTDEEPCIYDEKKNNLVDPTEDRGVHDINRSFSFKSNPQFIFHDSPGFEAGSETQIKQIKSFIAKRAESTEVHDQLHVIWYCFEPNEVRLLLDSDKRFFKEGVAGNVPVIAIATKFDDLITQVYTKEMGFEKSREVANNLLDEELEGPLHGLKASPKAYVRLEDMHDDDGTHQDQVKELIDKTADSLDNLALKMLFISIQQNNLDLCIRYAIKYVLPFEMSISVVCTPS
jgi:GTPase Era involved in 16S rRNA processing